MIPNPISCNFKKNNAVAQFRWAQTAIILIAFGNMGTALAQPVKEPSLLYTIKASDTMSRFGREVLVSPKAWQEVAKFNQLNNADVLRVGQQLDIPLRLLKSTPAGGKVISAEGSVNSKNGALIVGSGVLDGSSIQTGANSSAVIELGDGSRIKILPNSLAEVVANRNYALKSSSDGIGSSSWFSGLMRLTQGTLEAVASKLVARATPLQIETPTSLVGVRGTAFRVAFDDPLGKTARTEVIEGKVRAENPAQGVGADLPLGTGAVIKPLEKEVKVVLLLPAPDLSGVSGNVLKPLGALLMPTLAGANAYRVQVSSDEKFDKIVRDLKVATAAADLSTLPNGNWFVRVRGIDPGGLEGFDTVKLVSVNDVQWRVTDSSASSVDGKTVLRWAGRQADGQEMPGSNYSAVIANDVALIQSRQLVQGNDDKANLVLGDLKPGVYYISMQNSAGLRSATYKLELLSNWGQTVFYRTSVLQAVN